MQTAATFLMFSGKNFGRAEEAIKLYISLFEDSVIKKIEYFKEGEQYGKPGTIKQAHFILAGQPLLAHDSIVDHAFNFTASISIFVTFDKKDELEKVFNELKEDGVELMPLDDYGFSKRFGWVQDRYGVTWQLNLEG